MNTAQQLTHVFNDNFLAYFRSHVAHVNIVGRNFASDHALLLGVYEDLQDQIDIIAELLRTLGEFMPSDLGDIIADSHITDSISGSADDLLADVMSDLQVLKGCYEELIAVADEDGLLQISNYAQDRVLAIAKHIWMIESTLA